jgi:error-prone DNA polymerase
MPHTVKAAHREGICLLALEDEGGLINFVLTPDVFRKHRQLVRLKPLLIVDGMLEREDGVINVMAEKIGPNLMREVTENEKK